MGFLSPFTVEKNTVPTLSQKEKIEIARAVKKACLQTALDSYKHAKMSGLCHEGAWDLAIDALKSLDVTRIVKSLSGDEET